ncbi:uncharacterized protein LOC128782243 [Vidua chalybeata]|uniref:uncharacterized protein LOC128782243 n=1 Tax=Vidua chalybeata TaxID=81927 RepID=UPI0023A8A00B|nr:uncharacterized protein LOC128782243 [Vidua chalybeata]
MARSFNFQIDNVVSSFVVLYWDTFLYGQLTVTAVSKGKIFLENQILCKGINVFVIAHMKEGEANCLLLLVRKRACSIRRCCGRRVLRKASECSFQAHEGRKPRPQAGRSTGRAGRALRCSLSGRGVRGSWSSLSVPWRPPPSPGSGTAVGPRAQVVAPARGCAEHALRGRGALLAAGRAEHVLLVVVVRPDRVQDAAEALPAERAGGAHGSPLPDAGEAEGVQAGVHVRRVVHGAQADGAQPGCRCLPLPPARGGRRGGAALLQSLRGTGRHGLPRDGASAGASLAPGTGQQRTQSIKDSCSFCIQ